MMSDPVSSKKASQSDLQTLLPELAADFSPTECSARLGQIIRAARHAVLKKNIGRPKKGLNTASLLADATDAAVKGLITAGSAVYPEEAQHLAIAAVGGYGRGVLAPFSDLDILLLHGPYAGQKIKPLLDYVLYALWDAGLNVAQSVHSPASALDFIKHDLTGCTSFLDARFLGGSERLFADFHRRYEKHRKQTIPGFVEAKLEEREARLTEGPASRFRVEPDIKEGKGGLRDLQTLHWLARYVYGGTGLLDHVKAGAFSEDELMSFERARSFLWSVRVQLHDIRGRADEKLSFDVQPEVARRLGYRNSDKMPAAERLMKHYFITATEVGRLTGVICASLEEAEVKRPRLVMPAMFGARRMTTPPRNSKRIQSDGLGGMSAFCMRGNRIDFVDHTTLVERPLDLFRLFRLAGSKPACEIHPAALKTVAEVSGAVHKAVLRDPDIATVFKSILLDAEKPESVLRDMAETGLLGRSLPVFGRLVGRVKYGLHRLYTLDEHALKAVGILINIYKGTTDKKYAVAAKILAAADDVVPFFTAVLLHEAREAFPHLDEERVAKEIRNSARFLVAEHDVDDVIWAVMHYPVMADTVARRNVLEFSTIQGFCEEIGSAKRLEYLFILTVCHLSVVGLRAWDSWTRRDLTVLYDAAQAWFKGGMPHLNRFLHKRREDLRNKTARKLSDWSVPELERFFARLTPTFFESVTPDSAARFARMVREVDHSSRPGAASVRQLEDGRLELMVYSRDRPGLFAAIAGTIVSVGGVVRASTAFPIQPAYKGPDMAANIFVFRGQEGRSLIEGPDQEGALRALTERFEATVAGDFDLKLDMLPRIGDRRATFDVRSAVTLDQESSSDALVVEARGLDRPGLLYKLASALSESGISIRSAYVATYGEVAVDTFYLQDLPGYKITDKRRQETIKRKLLTVLNDR